MTMETKKRRFLFCSNFSLEVQAIRSIFRDTDEIHFFRGDCHRFDPKVDDIKPPLEPDLETHAFCTSCYVSQSENITLHREEQGCHLIAPPNLVDELQKEGAYVMGSSWLNNWKENSLAFRFDMKTQKEFWAESIQEFVHLDTGVLEDSKKKMNELSEETGRPVRSISLGLHYFQSKIEGVLSRLELKEESDRMIKYERKIRAENVMAFETISQLTEKPNENWIAQKILDLFTMLFAPEHIFYWPLRQGYFDVPISGRDDSPPSDPPLNEQHHSYRHQLWEDKKGFVIHLGYRGNTFGLLDIGYFAQAEKISIYFGLAQHLASSISMAIDNARKVSEIRANEILLRHDRNELRKNNLELKKLNDQVNKMVGFVSHDLRSPIGSVLNILNLYDSDDIDDEVVEEITQSLDHCLHLSNDLLDLTALETGIIDIKKERFPTQSFFEDVLSEHSHRIRAKDVHVDVVGVQSVHQTFGDRLRLKQVLSNLLSNAIKFSKRGSLIKMTYEESDKGHRFSVEDEGKGIPKSILDYIFKKDAKTSRPGTEGEKGTGFGLPLSYELILLHGGEMKAENLSSSGARFSFCVPEKGKKQLKEVPLAESETFHILLVEDDVFFQQKILECLETEGYELDICFEISESIDSLKAGRYDLVLLDLALPDGTGEDVLKFLRHQEKEHLSKIPVVMTTIGRIPEICHELGIQGVLQKPFSDEELIDTVKQLTGSQVNETQLVV